jgi:hypothetical protein
MQYSQRLISNRVPVSNSYNVPSDRYQFIDLRSVEPNLGVANNKDVLIFDSGSPGQRTWISLANAISLANNIVIDCGIFY